MHQKEFWGITALQIVAAFVLAVCAAAAVFQIQNDKDSTCGIKGSYDTFSAHIILPADAKLQSDLQTQFRDILKNKKATVVLVDDSSSGVGLYDALGAYPEARALSSSADSIVVEEGSAAEEAGEKQNGLLFSHGKSFRVQGKCPHGFPLLDSTHFYLYPLASSMDFSGTYFIVSKDSGLVDKLAGIFAQYGEAPSVTHSAAAGKQTADFGSTLFFLVSQRYFPVFAFGILILYFQYGLFFSFFVRRKRRLMAIHFRFGATKGRLLSWFSRWMLPCCFGGAFLGVLAYQLVTKVLFRQGMLVLPISWLIGTALFHGALTYLIFAAALLRAKVAEAPKKLHKPRKGAAAL